MKTYLSHHSHKRPRFKRLQRHAHEILVKEGADKKHGDRGGRFSVSHLDDRNVQVPAISPKKKIGKKKRFTHSTFSGINQRNYAFT